MTLEFGQEFCIKLNAKVTGIHPAGDVRYKTTHCKIEVLGQTFILPEELIEKSIVLDSPVVELQDSGELTEVKTENVKLLDEVTELKTKNAELRAGDKGHIKKELEEIKAENEKLKAELETFKNPTPEENEAPEEGENNG